MIEFDDEEQQSRDELARAIVGLPKHIRDRPLIDRLRTIVADKQAARVNGILVDLFSASAVVGVYDALNETNRAKFAAMPLPKMVDLAFKRRIRKAGQILGIAVLDSLVIAETGYSSMLDDGAFELLPDSDRD
jgi:RadC-like JAB domain